MHVCMHTYIHITYRYNTHLKGVVQEDFFKETLARAAEDYKRITPLAHNSMAPERGNEADENECKKKG